MNKDIQDHLTDNKVTDKFDTYDYTFTASKFRRLLWECAGADSQLLQRCPHSERVMMEGIGGVVLATAVLAFLSGSYAFYTVFGPKVGIGLAATSDMSYGAIVGAVVFGVIWALIIFNLDRFIVSSTGDGDGTEDITWGEVGRAVPRIIMACLIGISIAAPLEIRVMQSELDAAINSAQRAESSRLRDMVDNRFREKIASADELINEQQVQLKRFQDAVTLTQTNQEAARNQRDNQITGKGGETPGVGPKYQALDNSYNSAKASAEAAKQELTRQAPVLEKKIDELRTKREEVIKARDQEYLQVDRDVSNQDGLATRIALSHQLHPAIAYTLMLLLIMIELSPIFFKMMLTKGPYKYLIENQKYTVLARWGIEAKRVYARGNNSETNSRVAAESVTSDRFIQPETLMVYQRGQLEEEQALTKLQLDAYHAKKSAEILSGSPSQS